MKGQIVGAALGLLGVLIGPAQAQTTYYVDILNGDDDNDGESWALAFQTLRKGVREADTSGDEIRVAEGVYFTDVTTVNDQLVESGDRNDSFVLNQGVRLKGGYEEGGVSRNTRLFSSILDGDLNEDDEFGEPGHEYDKWVEDAFYVVTAATSGNRIDG